MIDYKGQAINHVVQKTSEGEFKVFQRYSAGFCCL